MLEPEQHGDTSLKSLTLNSILNLFSALAQGIPLSSKRDREEFKSQPPYCMAGLRKYKSHGE